MPEHCQRDRHRLREMQHYAAGNEDTDREPRQSRDDKKTFGRDKNTIEK